MKKLEKIVTTLAIGLFIGIAALISATVLMSLTIAFCNWALK
mgnify:FL=1